MGLAGIVSTSDPSVGALGGISRSSYDWWKANVEDTAGALTIADMVDIYHDCSYGSDTPDLILTTQELAASYEALLEGNQRYLNMARGDGGFGSLSFKGIPVEWDRSCTTSGMYFLTSKYLKIYCQEDNNFEVLEPVRAPNQTAEVYQVVWIGNIVCNNPRHFGVLKQRS